MVKPTVSLCPICKIEIPAAICTDTNVRIIKVCPDHGKFESVIECDPLFYAEVCRRTGSGQAYKGTFVDTGSQCNTSCKYCYGNKDKSTPSYAEILDYCRQYPPPFQFVGDGEPTCRDDLPELIREVTTCIGAVFLFTNGIKLADDGYLDDLLNAGLLCNGVAMLNISLNPRDHSPSLHYPLKRQAMDNLVRRKMKFNISFVVENQGHIQEALDILDQYRGYIHTCRLRVPSSTGATNSRVTAIYCSNVYNWLAESAERNGVDFGFDDECLDAETRHGFVVTSYGGQRIYIVALASAVDIDLMTEQRGEPFYYLDGIGISGPYRLSLM